MTLTKIFSQLAGGMWISIQIFFCDAYFFPASGTFHILWQDVEKSCNQNHCKILYFSHEGNASDAAADGGLFRSVLSV